MGKGHVLITGIAGFIGMNLAKRLQDLGYHVNGIDRCLGWIQQHRLEKLQSRGIQVYQKDICDIASIEELQTATPSHVIHLAASAGVRYSIDHPLEVCHNNLQGFIALLEWMKERQAKLIYASSSSVYGEIESELSSEEDRTDNPLSLYGASKKASEMIAHSYHHIYQLPVTGLRFFTVYGPWGRPDMAYFSFAQKILNREWITLFEPERMFRDFTYIDDVIDGIVAAMEAAKGYNIYNLGKGSPDSLYDLLRYLEKGLGQEALIEECERPLSDVYLTSCDTTKSQQELGYNPQVSLEEGLERFTAWFVENATEIRSVSGTPISKTS